MKIAGKNINYLRCTDGTSQIAESEEELKSPLMKVKEESEIAGLKLHIQKMKIMASGPITSWQIDGDTIETVTDFILGSSKITTNSDCSHEIGTGRGEMIWENGIKTCIISYKKRITSPGSIQDPWDWCTGMTRWDGLGRVVGGEFRMGNTCTAVADSC